MYSLSFTDGTTTVTVTSGSYTVTDLPINGPESDSRPIDMLEDGQKLGIPRYRNVTETISVLVSNTTQANVQSDIRAIEQVLERARYNRQMVLPTKVFVQFQSDGDTGLWRSEILAARVIIPKPVDQLWRLKVEIQITITRRYFWEFGTLTQLPLTSSATSPATTDYVTVYNDDDLSVSTTNWFQVAASSVTGAIPAPLKLEIRNGALSALGTQTVWLANYVHLNPFNADVILRGGEANSGATSNWAHADEQDTHRWAMPNAMLNAFGGQYAKALVAFSTRPDSTTLVRGRQEIGDQGPVYVDLLLGEFHQVFTHAIVETTAMPTPPLALGGNAGDLYYLLSMQAADSAGDGCVVDWIQWMPVGWGVYRKLKGMVASVSLESGESIIDDGVEGEVYAIIDDPIAVGTQLINVPYYRAYHEPIHVWPGKINRVRLMIEGNNTLQAAQPWEVKAYFRPRRLTL